MRKYGFPGSVRSTQKGGHTPKCCFYLKEKPMIDYVKRNKIGGIFVGIMGSESTNRRSLALRYGAMHYTVQPWYCHKIWPLMHWTDEDVWAYHDLHDIPRNEAYAKYGITRTGCATCTNFLDWEKVMEKWNPKMYARIKRMMEEQ
jgi:3'-phosphoadenosine 5'-phosphosulfate sulfotransferase (PAPS reductase)/FAD synthetase